LTFCCVCFVLMTVRLAETDEPIKMPFGADSFGPKEPLLR